MKTELLACIETARANALSAVNASFDAGRDIILSTVPDDPPPPDTPTGLRIIRTYSENPLCIELGWETPQEGCTNILEYKAAEGNGQSPQDWTGIPTNPPSQDTGARATLVLQNPDGQNILFRLTAQRDADGVRSEPCAELAFPQPE